MTDSMRETRTEPTFAEFEVSERERIAPTIPCVSTFRRVVEEAIYIYPGAEEFVWYVAPEGTWRVFGAGEGIVTLRGGTWIDRLEAEQFVALPGASDKRIQAEIDFLVNRWVSNRWCERN